MFDWFTPHSLLLLIRSLNVLVLIWLALGVWRVRHDYMGIKLLIFVLAILYRAVVLVINLVLIVHPGAITPLGFIVAAIADIPPIFVKVYLAGVFRGWWNGVDRFMPGTQE